MVTAMASMASNICRTIAAAPTRIAGAGASIIGIVVIGVAMVAAVTTMAGWRRRRGSSASGTAFRAQCLVETRGTLCGHVTAPLQEDTVCCHHIIVFTVSGHQCLQFFAHFLGSEWVCGNQSININSVKQLFLEAVAQTGLVLRLARHSKLIKHV